MITSIVAAVSIFAVLILVHEAGHFFVAKRLGVRVLRFSIGYPPRLFGIRRGQTDYAIGATPMGGYVKMLGDEIAEEPSSETISGYLGELKLDLLDAAHSTGWLERSGKSGDDALAAIAEEFEARALSSREISRIAISVGDASAALAKEFDEHAAISRQPSVVSILGREPKADEAILLREIVRDGTVKRAFERLAGGRPTALVHEFNQQAFPSQPLARRFAIVLAGPAANILFAPILMIMLYIIGLPTLLPVLGTVDPHMPGYLGGLRSGDEITAANGQAIDSWEEFSRMVKAGKGEPLNLEVKRGEHGLPESLQISVQPKLETVETVYGDKEPTWIIGVTPSGLEATRKLSPLRAVGAGVVETGRMAATLFIGIAKIIEGATPAREALGGPIMIAQIAGKEVHQGFADVILFVVTVSLELGVINVLPVPLLDGGHLLFFVIEGVRGEPLKLRHREIAMQVGLFLLAILMAFVILNDISRLVG
jgi:regulator of sigma E protease